MNKVFSLQIDIDQFYLKFEIALFLELFTFNSYHSSK